MTVLDFLKVAQDYSSRRRILLERIRRVLATCKKREECAIRIFKVLSDFLEKNPDENAKIALSVASSLPAEYGSYIVKFIEAFNVQEDQLQHSIMGSRSPDDVSRVLTGDIECSDLESIIYAAGEFRDFIATALTLAILERAGELRTCELDLARSLLALIRRLYERGSKDLVASILNRYSVKIYIHKSGEEIKGAKIAIGSEILVDLTEIMSLVYPDLSVILDSGNLKS